MLKSNTPKNLSPMRAGDCESRMGGVQYCLSPLPLPTDGEHALDVAELDVHHDDVTMDLRQGASQEGLTSAGHTLMFGFVFMFGFGLFLFFIMAIKGSGYVTAFIVWFSILYAMFLFVFNPAIPFVNTLLKRTPPHTFESSAPRSCVCRGTPWPLLAACT